MPRLAYRSAVAVFLIGSALSAQEPAKRPLSLADYGSWSRITGATLSPNGQWFAYSLEPNEGDATVGVVDLDGDTRFEGMNASDIAFSGDGRWVGFLSAPPKEEQKRLAREARRRESREGRTRPGSRRERNRDRAPRIPKTLHVIDLAGSDRVEEAGVRSFSFSEDGRFLAMHRDRPDPEADHDGSDLLLLDLGSGTVLSLGNVSQYAFNDRGDHLAYLVDAQGRSGNGLYLVSLDDGRVQVLRSAEQRFADLTWNEEGDALAALQGLAPEGSEHRENALLITTGIGGSPETAVYEPGSDPSFPRGFVLSELADTRWTEDGVRVVVGIKEQEDAEPDDEADDADEVDDETANVDVWHWTDDRLQSTQMIQAEADRRYTYASVYNLEDGRFLRLATEAMRRVDVTTGRWAVGRRDGPYRGDVTHAGGRADYVRIDLDTGEERTIADAVRRPVGESPDGDWWLYLADEQVLAVELATMERFNLSQAAGADFVDRQFDRIDEAPPYGLAGWTEDGAVLLNDRWDVWQVPLRGGAAVNLTGGAGAQEQIRYRLVRLDEDADFVDPGAAILSVYGEWTKRSGYARAHPGQPPAPLLVGDEMIDDLIKAEDADRVVFTRQTFEVFPDYWTAGMDFEKRRQVTDANPQISEFAWGRRVLVDYTDQRGHDLQATLALPAGYREGQRYPMIIYFYEKMSQRHHQFSMPVYDDRPHMSTYASNGYLVLMPDIVYDDGYPGSSALDDVTSAARRVIELGYADPERIGLQGHSWGGYETSFILTQTDMFRAIVTGAPLTNLMSMNNILYKRTGNQNGPILQWSQGRMGDQPWDDLERWISQSPVHHAPDITTPFLILHGTADGAVDWNQGLELYTAARRLGKEVILLSYPGEPHHLQKEANQKDFQLRMKQFFDHHLKGAPAPAWMTDGVPYLQKGKEAKAKIVS